MYNYFLFTHNLFRWLVLVLLLFALVLAFIGWFGKNGWTKRDNLTGILLTITMDIQLLLGLVLYFFLSPITKVAFSDFGAAMKNSEIRFYAVEHLLLMIIAVVLVHFGRRSTKKSEPAWKRHRAAMIWYGTALVLILTAIPWDRALM